LAESGATVVTTTFPDVAKILPTGRLIASRIRRINDAIAAASSEHAFRLVDLFSAPSMTAPGTWSHDRMHASTNGHILFASAAAEALGLPGSDAEWRLVSGMSPASPSRGGSTAQSAAAALIDQVQWTRNMFIPWLWNHFRGRSSGDGRHPKYPALRPAGQLFGDRTASSDPAP
jgi:hypothetical protein